jgi:hypothetical protein
MDTEFAQLVLDMLAKQQEFFKSKGDRQDLLYQCKDLEGRVKKWAKEIVNPPAAPKPGLFSNDLGGEG